MNGGVIFRRIGGRIIPIAKNIAIGTVAGGLAGRVVASAEGAEISGKKGAKIGAAVGIIASIPPRPVGRAIKHFATRYWLGVKTSAAATKAAEAVASTNGYSKASSIKKLITKIK